MTVYASPQGDDQNPGTRALADMGRRARYPRVVCRRCDGRAWIGVRLDEDLYGRETCPDCGGRGDVPKQKVKQVACRRCAGHGRVAYKNPNGPDGHSFYESHDCLRCKARGWEWAVVEATP